MTLCCGHFIERIYLRHLSLQISWELRPSLLLSLIHFLFFLDPQFPLHPLPEAIEIIHELILPPLLAWRTATTLVLVDVATRAAGNPLTPLAA